MHRWQDLLATLGLLLLVMACIAAFLVGSYILILIVLGEDD